MGWPKQEPWWYWKENKHHNMRHQFCTAIDKTDCQLQNNRKNTT